MTTLSADNDESFMRRAFRLAMNGRGTTEPNPSVGCVLVKEGRVIGEGHTQPFGGAHAEPTALASCTESPEGATAYVTLEPCCHTNKKTPPCAPRLIEAKVKRVVYGCLDPNPPVNGQGVAMLRAAGITVDGPVLEAEAKQFIAPFILRVLHRRPYVTLKWAETADGKVAGGGKLGLVNGKRLQISNARSSRVVHELRARSDAILVGARTIVADDPTLTARGVALTRPLIRCCLASRSVPFINQNLTSSIGDGPIRVYCTRAAFERRPSHAVFVETRGVTYVPVSTMSDGFVDLQDVLADLHVHGVTHLMVEPGPTVASSFFAPPEWADRVWVFSAPRLLNDETARSAATIPGSFVKTGEINLEGDSLREYLNPASAAFFASVPSADFVLTKDSFST